MKYDLIVLTAANDAQARGYRAQLKGRKKFLVIADPGGRRVGSLGATVNALRHLTRRGAKCPERVLICHSGGDAKRTPAYAAMGKAFVPMPDGRPLLDHILDAMELLPPQKGVTVCCGDVIPRLDYAKVSFAAKGVTGVAYPDGPWQAQRHGVYQTAAQPKASLAPVTGFLQKPPVTRGRFLIDTGIMHIDSATAAKMVKLPIAGDIYEEFPKMLLAGFAAFSVSIVDSCEFFHIGSSRELLQLLGKENCLVDGCQAPLKKLGGENIVTNVPAAYGPVSLARGECLTALPLGAKEWYYLRYRIDDTFKSDGLWEKHDLSAKMRQVNHTRLLTVRKGSSAVGRVRVTAPIRIDFAGGWSDTPPICEQVGGMVFNLAVSLEGKRSVEVTVSPRKDKYVGVISRDLGKRMVLKSAAEIADHSDPHDWCCLVKAALAVTGFVHGSRGIDIVLSADVPKGSGMGTSSVLGAATIAALLGRVDAAEVAELTLRLEQEMHTGGGWQDQFGGLLGGWKLLVSKPGKPQRITVKTVVPPEAFVRAFRARSLLFFTGQKRMARNILFKVLKFHRENPHGFADILIAALKEGAQRCARAVAQGDLTAFAQAVNDYWRDKKLLDPGSTNERVDDIIARIESWTSAVTLCGAGGGGFMYILAKSPDAAQKIRRALGRLPDCRYAKFYDFDIDAGGLALERF